MSTPDGNPSPYKLVLEGAFVVVMILVVQSNLRKGQSSRSSSRQLGKLVAVGAVILLVVLIILKRAVMHMLH